MFCGTCGAKLVRESLLPPDPDVAARVTLFQQRIQNLRAYASGHQAVADQRVLSLLSFMGGLGLSPSVYAVTPEILIWFLISGDSTARTIVHQQDCAALGSPNPALTTCHDPRCAKRTSGTTLRTKTKQLSKAFKDAGLVSDWNPQLRTGNPIKSQPVREYIRLANAEQSAARVEVRQAPLFNEQIFHHLVATVLQRAATLRTRGSLLEAANTLVDALFYAYMWYTGSRAQDALRTLASDLRSLHDPTDSGVVSAWDLRLALSKTRRDPTATFHATLANDFTAYHPIYIWTLLCSVLEDLGVGPPRGPLFRQFTEDHHGAYVFGSVLSTGQAATRLSQWLAAAGLPTCISLHSFHGSHAAHRLANGDSRQAIVNDMDWSVQSLMYYLSQAILTLTGSIASPLTRAFTE